MIRFSRIKPWAGAEGNGSFMARITLPACYPILIELNLAHWYRDGTHHGPQSNPLLCAVKRVWPEGLHEHEPGKYVRRQVPGAWRLWAYFRGGYAFHIDVHVDQRPVEPRIARWRRFLRWLSYYPAPVPS